MSTLLNRLFHRSQEPVKEYELSPALKRDDRVAKIAMSMDTVALADRFYREHATAPVLTTVGGEGK